MIVQECIVVQINPSVDGDEGCGCDEVLVFIDLAQLRFDCDRVVDSCEIVDPVAQFHRQVGETNLVVCPSIVPQANRQGDIHDVALVDMCLGSTRRR